MTRKKLLFLLIFLFLGILLFFCLAHNPSPKKPPQASSPGTITLTSNGCCFWAEDIRVLLEGPDGVPVEVSYDPAITENDIFSHPLPDGPDGPLSLKVEFRCFYGDEVPFSRTVMDFETAGELRQKGVLLYFQEHDDMYLHVISGDDHVSYKMGSPKNRWLPSSAPL